MDSNNEILLCCKCFRKCSLQLQPPPDSITNVCCTFHSLMKTNILLAAENKLLSFNLNETEILLQKALKELELVQNQQDSNVDMQRASSIICESKINAVTMAHVHADIEIAKLLANEKLKYRELENECIALARYISKLEINLANSLEHINDLHHSKISGSNIKPDFEVQQSISSKVFGKLIK